MRKRLLAVLVSLGLVNAACHGSSGGGGGGGGVSSGPVTAPSPPVQGQPATVYVGGGPTNPDIPINQDGTLTWGPGTVSWDGSNPSNALALALKQSGAQVSGMLSVIGPDGTGGPLAGSISGNTFSFNFSVGNQGQGCGNAMSATATVGTNTITGTFSGRDCRGQPITNGKFTVSLPDVISTTRLPVSGTWTGILGGSELTLVIAQDGDVAGGNLTGSVSVSSNNPSKLGPGSLTGTVTNIFPGPAWSSSFSINFTLGGVCPANLQGSPTRLFPDGIHFNSGVSGTWCTGSFPNQIVFWQKR